MKLVDKNWLAQKSADLNGVTPISRSMKKTSEMRMSHATESRFLRLSKPQSFYDHKPKQHYKFQCQVCGFWV